MTIRKLVGTLENKGPYIDQSTGHIRLRLKHKKHTSGNWINRDPAAVADTTDGNVRSIWCSDGYLIANDPSWIFTDLYSS